MIIKISRLTMAILAIFTGLYPFVYFFVDPRFSLLQSKPDAILTNTLWNIGFYTHITSGGVALLIGWMQFSKRLRTNRVTLHRTTGKIYVATTLLSSIASIYIARYATGGIIASSGFMCLGLCWFFSTFKAYIAIRNKNVETHQKMMIYSYSFCLAAVTLRIYLPLLTMAFHDFTRAYLLVAWLCWLPNLVVAFFIVKNLQPAPNLALTKHERTYPTD